MERVEAEWYGLHPRLELGGVKVYDRSGAVALELPYVGATVAWRTVLARELRFKSLVLDRPDLDVRRDPQGRLFIAGLELRPSDAPEGGVADWLLAQGEIIVRDARVEWRDERRGAPPLALERLSFVLENDGRHHRFALRAEPPRAFASALGTDPVTVSTRPSSVSEACCGWKAWSWATSIGSAVSHAAALLSDATCRRSVSRTLPALKSSCARASAAALACSVASTPDSVSWPFSRLAVNETGADDDGTGRCRGMQRNASSVNARSPMPRIVPRDMHSPYELTSSDRSTDGSGGRFSTSSIT